ncbi:hypothetical protein ACQPYK_05815 [Streptosporangium sp. CA-135522]|uniref:hypothetical protein n=1 Tax=Streptosporangium sp. CA-135522 TaxID=3240072 RepID=UPI003D8A80D6
MRIHAGQKRDGKSPKTPRTPLPERSLPPAAPRHTPMPHMPMRPTQQPRRIPGKGGR